MFKQLLLAFLFLSCMTLVSESSFAVMSISDVSVINNCSGTQVVRVAPGKFEVRYVESGLPGCRGNSVVEFRASTPTIGTSETITIHEVTNCSGLRVTSLSNGKYASTHVASNLPGCIDTSSKNTPIEVPRIDLSQGPLLDLASTEIVAYRNELLKKQ